MLAIEQEPIWAKVIEDSVSELDIRLLTVQVRYPRFIHSELMTHRVFSRNARSSRAVPTPKLLKEPIFMPEMGVDQKGMQAGAVLEESTLRQAQAIWDELAEYTRARVQTLHNLGVHKQWANRPLEWFGFIDVLITSTEWANFYNLRDHPDAAPEIQELARVIRSATRWSTPTLRTSYNSGNHTGWHLPFITEEERLRTHDMDLLKQMSTARCARISYTPFDTDKADPEADLKLYKQLMIDDPLHASPSEHQATPDFKAVALTPLGDLTFWATHEEHGNLYGWRQYRKMLPNENCQDGHHGNN